MSFLSKSLRKVQKYIAPAVAGFATGGFAGAGMAIAGTSSTLGRITGGPVTKAGAMPMSLQAGNFPSFPSFPALPGGGAGGGGIVKTGLPLLAAAGTAVVRAAPAVVAGGRALLAKISPKVAKALGWATVGGLVYDAAGNVMGQVKRRQMNPLNPRAARRAVRRIKSVRKLCANIERTLPKSKSRGPRRC